jgi:tetratricopeptide (TPR) repeat protein
MPRTAKYLLAGLLLFQTIHAQNKLDEQLKYADKLFETGQFFDAITEYKRVLYFDSEERLKDVINFKIAKCYKAGAHFGEAIKYFSLAEKVLYEDSSKFRVHIEIIRCNILRRTTARALQLCDKLSNNRNFHAHSEEINYWRGWAYMFADDWEAASKAFSHNADNKELKLLCDRVMADKVSVTFAKVISYILPGSGQIYSGKIFSGLMSLAWNLAAGYFTVNAFVASRAFDGIIIAELGWLRFYKGNIENAESFAVNKNFEVANKALNFLQNEYKGLKP